MYEKIKGETIDGTPKNSYEYWITIRKDELGSLYKTNLYGGAYVMYSLEKDMRRFAWLVTANLGARAGRKYDEYVDALRMFQEAEIAANKLREED
jgi:hypothetical protein